MKRIGVSVILFTLISSAAFAQLTKEDLEEIRTIVKESEERLRVDFKEGIASVRAELKGEIATVRWMVGLMFGVLGGIVATALTLPWIIGRSDVKELRERVFRLEAKGESG